MNFRTPAAFNLSFGPIESDGTSLLLFSMDHRVIDGMTAMRAFNELESVLNEELLGELRASAAVSRAA